MLGNEKASDRDTWHDNWLPFMQEYYKVKPYSYSLIEHTALMEYYGSKADFAFSHAKMFSRKPHPFIPNIHNQMSEKTYMSYKVDIQGHFNEAGHKFMAKWVAQNTNLAFSE